MAIQGLRLTAVRPYVSNLDPAKGQPNEATDATIWQLGTLDSRVQGYLKDLTTKFKVSGDIGAGGANAESIETSVSQSEVNFETVRWGLRGWKNFVDENGDIAFQTKGKQLGGSSTPYQVVPAELVALIPVEIVTELAGELRKKQEVTVEEKNA